MRFDTNVTRSVKPTPPLSGRQIALARSCCSITGKKTADNQWIYLILVDATRASICCHKQPQTIHLKQVPLHGGPEDFEQAPSYSIWRTNRQLAAVHNQNSTANRTKNAVASRQHEPLIKTIVGYFKKSPPSFNAENPILLSIAYYPIRIALSEWKLYSLLLSRYVKHYEYSLISYNLRLRQSILEELQPWRRRCVQSRHKLSQLHLFLSKHIGALNDDTPAKDLWNLVLNDVSSMSLQISHWAAFLDSMVMLLDTHQSLIEMQEMKRLTYVALGFVPLSLVAAVFSMNEKALPKGVDFGIYFAVAVPVTLVVLVSCRFVQRLMRVWNV